MKDIDRRFYRFLFIAVPLVVAFVFALWYAGNGQ